MGSVAGLERSPGEGNGNPLWYSCLGNPRDRGVGGLQFMGSRRAISDLAPKQQPLPGTVKETPLQMEISPYKQMLLLKGNSCLVLKSFFQSAVS